MPTQRTKQLVRTAISSLHAHSLNNPVQIDSLPAYYKQSSPGNNHQFPDLLTDSCFHSPHTAGLGLHRMLVVVGPHSSSLEMMQSSEDSYRPEIRQHMHQTTVSLLLPVA